ncbi:c-type cytochrome [Propionivibrio sp.]|uniref:c-type cytochrome n=1 Tax=Propionivibrio sp. TaxID=2212460 RepID=UPI00272DCED7|nr:c-type cytochrome [Propionivibrio sp.]
MKIRFLCLIGILSLGASGAVLADESLAKAKGCLACHTVEKKLIGPTYKEVAQEYAGQKDAEARLTNAILKGTPLPGGVGWQKKGKATMPFMPPNAAVKPDDAAKLAKWILSLK